jgi:hypothetical protein
MLSVVMLNVVLPSVVALSRDNGHQRPQLFIGEKSFYNTDLRCPTESQLYSVPIGEYRSMLAVY